MKSDFQASSEQDDIRQFYNQIYYKDPAKNTVVTRHLRRLAAKLSLKKGKHVLDVACGTGEWLLAAAERGAVPFGIDISHKVIDICRQNIVNGEFYVGVAEELPFEDNQFDLVSCLGSLEHFVNPELALKEMIRVAKYEAQFLLLVPNADFLTHKLGLYRGTNQAAVKEEVKTLTDWQKLFERSGLSILQRWPDLHILSYSWIVRHPWYLVPVRTVQAASLLFWPLAWQYQVYFLCCSRRD